MLSPSWEPSTRRLQLKLVFANISRIFLGVHDLSGLSSSMIVNRIGVSLTSHLAGLPCRPRGRGHGGRLVASNPGARGRWKRAGTGTGTGTGICSRFRVHCAPTWKESIVTTACACAKISVVYPCAIRGLVYQVIVYYASPSSS